MPEPGKCRSCQAHVLWVQSASTGNMLIVDAEPVPNGNIAIKDGKAVHKKGGLFDELIEGPFYIDHHATCPEAARWKKRKAKKDGKD